MNQMVVTGGFGFLGANFLRWWNVRHPRAAMMNVDCLTYAGSTGNLGKLRSLPKYSEHRINIVSTRRLKTIWPRRPVTVVHFAAETHVDRSLIDAQPFARTNVLGTQSILELAREFAIKRLIIISTDEVYGPAPRKRKFTESQPLNPANPYAASKAAADLLAAAYRQTYNLPIIVLRSVNVYGPRQYPEKFIPLFTTNALAGKPLPLYGDGRQERDWLWVDDFCAAVGLLVEAPQPKHTVYHIAAGRQMPNIDVAKQIVELTGCSSKLLRMVDDRPGHDRRYALDDRRFRREFGWRPHVDWAAGLEKTVSWYREHLPWVERRKRRSFADYYRRQYDWRLHG